jgi:ADP-heptose:LPS heptosyltransferase
VDRKNIKKILVVIPHRGIGDIIFHLPLLRSLKERFKTKLYIISNQNNKAKEILYKENLIKKIIYLNFNRGSFMNYILNFFILKKNINNFKADLTILTDPSKRLVIPLFFSNSKNKIYSGVNTFMDFISNKKHYRKNFLAKNLDILMTFLKINNARNNYKLNFISNNKDIVKYKKLKKPWFFINIDSHHNHNNWDLIFFNKIIKKLQKKTIFINTSPKNIKLINSLKIEPLKKNIIITSMLSIKQLMKIIYNCELIIGNETGPICLASALNKKVISIYNENYSKPESSIISSSNLSLNATKLGNKKVLSSILKVI